MSSTPGWETIKENAAPLQRGRNVAVLDRSAVTSRGVGSLFQPAVDESGQRIEEFERAVRPSEAPHVTAAEDDPLVQWMSYIKFCQDHFPSDTHQQFLLMERCTRALVNMPQYANDDRFISVCAKYADKTKEPGQVFKYLHQQRVGQKTALFWVAWAFVAEKGGDFPFAEHIYKKGISKDAQPINMLQMRHKQFQRRMSRHWLNSSQRNDQLDEYEGAEGAPSSGSRGALGGLSQEGVRRNERSRVAPQLSQRSRVSNLRATTTPGLGSRSSFNAAATGSVSIFVDNEGENAPNSFLDQSVVESKRVIERESDRRKENTLDAERWNERGGLVGNPSSSVTYLSRSSQSGTGSRGAPPPAFAVFVDEECVAQNDKLVNEKQDQAERHRTVRDERTFRDRTDEGLAERLSRDPLRYVRDPMQFESDQATAAMRQDVSRTAITNTEPQRSSRRANIGFNKKLLKNEQGIEQSFEEARGRSMYYVIATSAVNFNLLHVSSVDHSSSRMDLDEEEESENCSMDGSSSKSTSLTSEEQPRKISRFDPKHHVKALFFGDQSSRNASLNQTAISNSSSAVNESDAVGVPTRREEETINTKLAMRELSMMFSSPAFGVDNLATKTERRRNYMSRFEDDRGTDASFADVGDSLGHSMLDNSIINYDNENQGPRNPSARVAGTAGLDAMALREISTVSEVDSAALGCSVQGARVSAPATQYNPLRGIATERDENVDFEIFEEGIEKAAENTDARVRKFQIFQDTVEEDRKPAARSFSVYKDTEEENDCNSSDSDNVSRLSQGDTATFTMLMDVAGLDESDHVGDRPQRRDSSIGVIEQGDTATLSVFNDIFIGATETRGQQRSASAPCKAATSGGFCIFVEEDAETHSIRESLDDSPRDTIDYLSTYERGTRMALHRLQTSSSVASNSRSPLLSLLSLHGQNFHLPHISLPVEFRSKHISGNTNVQIGKHIGVMCRELGRGAYGVVVLMDLHDDSKDGAGVIAVKAQTSTAVLAWECEILRRLEGRAKEKVTTYSFPSPRSFISLADGGILSMTAASRTGFNLVDLANIYKLRLGEHVPEIVSLHYVSRMLRHLEKLHWNGKIIHCDVKPDNFVLCTLDCVDNRHRDIEFSELMLVDFGRAVDLEDYADGKIETRSVMFRGEACQQDAQCLAMRAGKPWSYDIDTFGVLACAHVLLWGTHIRLRKGTNGRLCLANTFKRYWQKELWTSIFDKLLNLDEESGAIGSRPRSLRSLRMEIDNYTEKKSEKLRSFLNRQLSLLPLSRDQLV